MEDSPQDFSSQEFDNFLAEQAAQWTAQQTPQRSPHAQLPVPDSAHDSAQQAVQPPVQQPPHFSPHHLAPNSIQDFGSTGLGQHSVQNLAQNLAQGPTQNSTHGTDAWLGQMPPQNSVQRSVQHPPPMSDQLQLPQTVYLITGASESMYLSHRSPRNMSMSIS